MAQPTLAALLTPDDTSVRTRRLAAGLGVLSGLLALSVVADWLALLLLAVGCVIFTAYALFAQERLLLLRFVVVNGAAMLLLGWAVSESSLLTIQRTPEQLEVTLNGVRLAATTAGIDSPLNRLTVEVGAVEERPVAAPWIADSVPLLAGFNEWLVGGMRGGLSSLRVVDANDSDLVPSVEGLWHSDRAAGPPRLSGSADAWTVGRAADATVTVNSPEIFTNRYAVLADIARPSAQVKVTLHGEDPGTVVEVVAAPDRRYFAVQVRPPDRPADILVGGPFVFRRSVVGWTQTLLREIGRVWLVALTLVAASRLLALPTRVTAARFPKPVGVVVTLVAAVLIGTVTTFLTSVVALGLLDGVPHTVESIAYLFQAQVIAGGGLWAQAPILPEFFEQAYVAATADGRWFGVLPPGQSMLLAYGMQYGAPWLVSPLMSGLALGLIVVLGRATYGTVAGLLAGVLLLFSPFLLMLSGDMLAHPAALLLTVVLTLGVATALYGAERGLLGSLGWMLAGLAMGGLVLTRPLAAGGIGVPMMLVLVLSGRGQPLRPVVVRAAIFAFAAAPGVFYAAFVNGQLSGSAMLPPLSLWSEVDRIGFGPNVGTRGGHDLANALGNAWANTAVLLRHLYGWPSYLTLALAAVPFVLGPANRWDRLFLMTALGLGAAHLLYWSDGIIYGPRFAFEAVGALALLTARGVLLLARADGRTSDAASEPEAAGSSPVASPASDESPAARSVAGPVGVRAQGLSGVVFAAVLLTLLFAINVVGYLPEIILAYRDYNGVSRQNLQLVEQAGLEQAVVFVTSDWPNWQAYGSVFLANTPALDRTVVYARDLGEIESWRLLTRYPEHRWWLLRDGQLTEIRR
ncbi:MAG: hypothetical protein IT306_18510 [Chloroflexi bacterium]|nr:hypothetical protein [Chloroflexota bacterium]